MIYTIIFCILLNLLYTLSSFSKIKTKNLRITNTFCKRISPVEYKIQTNNHTHSALKNLKAFCSDDVQRDPINFACNILNKVKKDNRYILIIIKL